MKLLSVASVAAALLFSAIVVIPFLPQYGADIGDYVIEAELATESPGQFQIYFDSGAGFNERESTRIRLKPDGETHAYQLSIRSGSYLHFRIDPIDSAQPVRLARLQVLGESSDVIRDVNPDEMQPVAQIARVLRLEQGVEIVPESGMSDPQLVVTFDPPLSLGGSRSGLVSHLTRSAVVALALLGILFAADRFPAIRRLGGDVREMARRRPVLAVFAAGALSALISCYPVVLFGRSHASPNYSDGTYLLYDGFPTVPGDTSLRTQSANGSDVGALAWAHLPYSLVQHRAIFEHGELPLWNRYNSCGLPLLGQGQSMLGDPLHLFVVVAGGNAWAWDIKYLVAKALLGVGIGLIVLYATAHLPAALISALTSVWIGFFLYRVNHPAIFSLCYAPWILFGWLRFSQSSDLRTALKWAALIVFANIWELNSGTVKEAYLLVAFLQLTGGLVFLLHHEPTRQKLAKTALVCGALLVFVLVSAPFWLVFFDTLQRARTSSFEPVAYQISPSLLLGLFDEIFYRPLLQDERVWNPSANILVLLGVTYVLATIRKAPPDRFKRACLLGTFPPLAIGFGLVPPQWLAATPFLRNVQHVDDVSSTILIVHVLVLAGIGYALAAQRLRTREGRGDLGTVGAIVLIMVAAYAGYAHVVHRTPLGARPVVSLWSWGERMAVSPFVQAQVLVLLVAAVILGLTVWHMQRRGRWSSAGTILVAICLAAMLWRFGQHAHVGFRKYVFSPPARADLLADSPAIQAIHQRHREPYRVVGTYRILTRGWSAAYDLESTTGVDAIMSRQYIDLLAALSDAAAVNWIAAPPVSSLTRSKKFLDLLNVRTYLDRHSDPRALGAALRKEFSTDLEGYSSDQAWPRAFFTDRVEVYGPVTEFAQLVDRGDGRPFAAISNRDVEHIAGLSSRLEGRIIVPATDYELTNNRTSFSITTPSAGIVVLHESWWQDDFRASVNGRTVPYLRVNHAFKGVLVPAAGDYRIEFAYWPRRLTLALWLAAGGLALAAAGSFLVLRLAEPKPRAQISSALSVSA